MAILQLSPSAKDYIWGGQRLAREYGKQAQTPSGRIAETWELSCHPDGPCYVSGCAQTTLRDYIAQHGTALLGSNCLRFEDFPVLIKLIDAQDNLSIQVHPDNAYALKNEHQYGKTEMWYVVDALDGSSLYYGFKRQVTPEEFAQSIKDGTLLDLLNKVPVKKGDVFFIDAGTVHAIGKGILIAEIQQNSNVTYRIYDYQRKDAQGKERALHVDQALAVTNFGPAPVHDFKHHLGLCSYFCVDKLTLDGTIAKSVELYADHTSFVSILVLSGSGIISDGTTSFAYKAGESYFVPAATGTFSISGEIEALITTIPNLPVALNLALSPAARSQSSVA